jgi:hypothetical protein
MKNRSFSYKIFLFILLLPLLAGCRQQSPSTSETVTPDSETGQAVENKTYTSDEFGFSLEYPADWNLKKELTESERNFGIRAVIEGPHSAEYDYMATIIIKVQELSQDITTEEFAEAVEVQILKKNLPDYVSLEEKTTTIGGIPAIARKFTATMSDAPCKDIQAYFIRDNCIYTITYDVSTDCHDMYAGCFGTVIDTFTFR